MSCFTQKMLPKTDYFALVKQAIYYNNSL